MPCFGQHPVVNIPLDRSGDKIGYRGNGKRHVSSQSKDG
jgi:hypothetical protein